MITQVISRMHLLLVLLLFVLVTAGMTLALNPQAAAERPVDADKHHVVKKQFLAYVTNEGSNDVSVINTKTNTVVDLDPATPGIQGIPVGIAPAGVAFTPNGKTAYVANLISNTVSVIDTKTNTVVATINGEDESFSAPLAVAITPDGARVYVTNFGPFPQPGAPPPPPSFVSVIDTKTNTVVATIGVGVLPEGVAISPNGRTAYVANEGSNTVSVIDTKTNTVVDLDPTTPEIEGIPVGMGPSGVAFTPNGRRAYVTNYFDNFVSVIDTKTNTVVDEITVGPLCNGLAISPNEKQRM